MRVLLGCHEIVVLVRVMDRAAIHDCIATADDLCDWETALFYTQHCCTQFESLDGDDTLLAYYLYHCAKYKQAVQLLRQSYGSPPRRNSPLSERDACLLVNCLIALDQYDEARRTIEDLRLSEIPVHGQSPPTEASSRPNNRWTSSRQADDQNVNCNDVQPDAPFENQGWFDAGRGGAGDRDRSQLSGFRSAAVACLPRVTLLSHNGRPPAFQPGCMPRLAYLRFLLNQEHIFRDKGGDATDIMSAPFHNPEIWDSLSDLCRPLLDAVVSQPAEGAEAVGDTGSDVIVLLEQLELAGLAHLYKDKKIPKGFDLLYFDCLHPLPESDAPMTWTAWLQMILSESPPPSLSMRHCALLEMARCRRQQMPHRSKILPRRYGIGTWDGPVSQVDP